MSHHKRTNFSAKHPADAQVPDHLIEALTPCIQKGSITCADAHDLARRIGVSAQQMGIAIDLCEARISACQLGLFGIQQASTDRQAADGPPGLEQVIQAAVRDNGLSCVQAWQIAQTQAATRLQVGRACNALGIKIRKCQLGAF